MTDLPKIPLTINDYLIIAAYFVGVLIIGFKTKSDSNSVKDYLIAGRTLTLPAFIATIVASFYGGILGIGEFTFRFGISGWLLYALPYYIFITVFAFFLANKIRRTHLYTIPDKLNRVYGKKVSVLGGILIFFLATPAPYLFMMAVIIKWVFAIKLAYAMLFSLLVSIIYLIKGGFRSDVRVNMLEFVIMFVGFGIILPFCINTLGGFDYLNARLPKEYLQFPGSVTLQYFITWFFIGSWALIDPVFYQRCYAVKSKKTPKRGILISLVFWFIFDIMTTLTGLYSKAFFLNDKIDPVNSIPMLAQSILPPIAKGIFITGLLATIMSSLHSYIFISSTTFGKDIVSKLRNEDTDEYRYSKIGMAVSGFIALVLAYFIPSVVDLWYTVGTMIIPALLISVITSYFDKLQVHSKYIFAAMITSFSVSLISFILGMMNKVDGVAVYPFSLEPMYPGLVAGLLVYLIGYANRKFLKTESDY
ncbi:MAG TPA: sodium:solute symporter family protein [Ignavibacteria bacterium]|nr:sodium:solute symporter family protein [Ignavibacteria bacterium]HMR39950.1 sodium:solute symporter family protein [Ignavibacteria bacterium]